jgi:predicted GNAT family N-acyltransferase
VSASSCESQFGEQAALTEQDWADVVDQEDEPFGPIGAGLYWRPKVRHVTCRAADGRLVATAGALVARVQVGAEATFDVVGLGSVIVTRSLRGHGLMPKLIERLLRIARAVGPDRAMLFCRPELVGLYERFQFIEIAAPVWVDQPDGRIEMPEPAMWRALRPGAQWPPGPVEVHGFPF